MSLESFTLRTSGDKKFASKDLLKRNLGLADIKVGAHLF